MGRAMSASLPAGRLVLVDALTPQPDEVAWIDVPHMHDALFGTFINTGSLNPLAGARMLAAAERTVRRRPRLERLCVYEFPPPFGKRWFYLTRRVAQALTLLATRPAVTTEVGLSTYGIDVRSQVAALRWILPVVSRPVAIEGAAPGDRPRTEWSLVAKVKFGPAALAAGAKPLTNLLPPLPALVHMRVEHDAERGQRRAMAMLHDAKIVEATDYLDAPVVPRQGVLDFDI